MRAKFQTCEARHRSTVAIATGVKQTVGRGETATDNVRNDVHLISKHQAKDVRNSVCAFPGS